MSPGVRKLSLILLGATLAGCATDRPVGPEVSVIPPDVRQALTASGVTGPTAVVTVIRADGSSYVRVAGTPGRSGSGGIEASATINLTVPDIDPRFLLFITNPSGPNTFGAPNEVTVVWAFFCVDVFTGQQIRAFEVDVHEISNIARAGTGGHGIEHSLDTKPVGEWMPESGHTAADGTFRTTYRSKAAAGDEEVHLTYTIRDAGSPCEDETATGIHFIGIRHPGLVPIEAVNGIYFDDITSDHNTVFFATPAARDATYRAALYYLLITATDDEPGVVPLRVNAASLFFGGLNDVRFNWSAPHRTHRAGTDVDLDGKTGSAGDNWRVWKKVKLASEAAGFERCDVHNMNHVHCYDRLY